MRQKLITVTVTMPSQFITALAGMILGYSRNRDQTKSMHKHCEKMYLELYKQLPAKDKNTLQVMDELLLKHPELFDGRSNKAVHTAMKPFIKKIKSHASEIIKRKK